MLPYWKENVNPKKHKTGDCSTRALCTVLGISYEEAINLQAKWAIKKCYGLTDRQTIDLIMKECGYVKMKQPRKQNGEKYTVREMDKVLTRKQSEHPVLVNVANHYTCIVSGWVQDTWDCRDKTVGNYYVKAGL